MDIVAHYDEYTYVFLMSIIAYTFVCAGISYLSNLTLIILIDLGKYRWFFSDKKIKRMRILVHIVVGLINAGIII